MMKSFRIMERRGSAALPSPVGQSCCSAQILHRKASARARGLNRATRPWTLPRGGASTVAKLTFIFCLFAACAGIGQDVKILTDHVGYEQDSPKRAVISGRAADEVKTFRLIDSGKGREVLSGTVIAVGPVGQWKDWRFWTVDFSGCHAEGTFLIECSTGKGVVRSFPFPIQRNLLERNTLSSVLYYFKGQRCSGQLDKADRHLKFEGSTNAIDAHGGWYDATGDYGKHLSHLSFSTYFNPQQIPLTVWSLFNSYEELKKRDDPNFRQYQRRLLDEAVYGADYLVRIKSPSGSFYRSVSAPGPEKRPEDRRIAREGKGFAIKTTATKNKLQASDAEQISGEFPYEVSFRSGGGVAIAALAAAGACSVSGDFSSAVYLKSAGEAFDFLEKHNLLLANDGKENIVDDYCALLAAVELYKSTQAQRYKDAASLRAENLMRRLVTSGAYTNYWRADDGDRPFFHAADAGMPVVSLLSYASIADEPTRSKVLQAVRKSLEFELRLTDQVPNPFGYARQLVQSTNGLRRTAFFFPHDAETAPWWQGENARLGSLAAAARMAAREFKDDAPFAGRLRAYAWSQLHWILGMNPFDACLLHGSGRNNVPYLFFNSYEYNNAPGGICNGITAGYANPEDIDFNLGFAVTGKDEDWRWSEQWLPHASWYLLAISVGG